MKTEKNKNDNPRPYNYGGQALIEGVMMRGRTSMAIAVREPSGNVAVECKRVADVKKSVWYRIPVVRGVFNFISTLGMGFKTLMRSAEAAGEEDEQIGKGGMTFAVVIALVLFVGLFIFLPRLAASGLETWLFKDSRNAFLYTNLIESAVRILIFVLYLWLVSLMKDIRRTYMYHGAEHKTINAYEKGGELTVEGVRKYSTRHNRCGTTFLFFVIIISIIVFTVVTWGLKELGLSRETVNNGFLYNLALMGIRLALLPFVAGLSYELLRLLACGSDRNIVLRVLRAPGLGLQRLTTKEPDDSMLEVAIVSFNAARAMDGDPGMKDYLFELTADFKSFYEGKTDELKAAGADAAALDWVCCDILDKSRSGLGALKIIKRDDAKKISALCDRLKAGQPLQYIQGYTEFMGYKFAVDRSVLIPRQETEILAAEAAGHIGKARAAAEQAQETTGEPEGGRGNTGYRVLDLCCGSGCIGITLALKTGAEVTLSDISADALAVAKKNAESLGAEKVSFVQGDMFENIAGKFDLIAFNPPYIKSGDIEGLDKSVRDHEPRAALDGGEDGLKFYRAFKDGFKPFLAGEGKIFMEIGAGQTEDIKNIFKEFYIKSVNDYNGIERVLIVSETEF